ncbi:MAG: succinate dehydrogenase iron-sulfur subunit [Candidatus Marinimicrobia bacterium]|nr:succinate dehydrogenase iron-sulfur subunit [Candidatus Neomarinimicrobiota bacterium]
MEVTVDIYRYDQETGAARFDRFVKEVDPKDRVLDVMMDIKDYDDGTIAFRKSCGHGVCGSDAMQINGINRLACQTLIQDLKSRSIRIEPLKGMKVLRDLIVDMDPFFTGLERIKPYFIPKESAPVTERRQSIAERALFDDTTKCIMCGACTTSCPSFWTNDAYVGPAAFVKAHRFIMDSRDGGNDQRLEALDDKDGLWRCHSIFNCTDACPRDIQITKAIGELKRYTVAHR